MIFSHQQKWINPVYRCRGGHISLKVGERIDISGVLAPVIHAIVGINFVRTASWEAMFCIIGSMLFLY
jgi:hypothetical protein